MYITLKMCIHFKEVIKVSKGILNHLTKFFNNNPSAGCYEKYISHGTVLRTNKV